MSQYFAYLVTLTCGHKRKATSREQELFYCLKCDKHVEKTTSTPRFSYERDRYKGYKHN